MPNKAKKFALIGTSCIGKSTLINNLREIIPERLHMTVEIAPEAARHYFSSKKVRKPFSFTNQKAVQTLAKKFEMEAEKKNPDIILCDRSVFDAVAYVHAVGRKDDAQKLYNRVIRWLTTYNHLFLLDPEGVPYKTDEIRKESQEIRQMFHESFMTLLTYSKLPFSLISGTQDQRLKQIVATINSGETLV